MIILLSGYPGFIQVTVYADLHYEKFSFKLHLVIKPSYKEMQNSCQ